MEVVGGRRPQGRHCQHSIWVLFDHSLFPQSKKERIRAKLSVELYLFPLGGSARLTYICSSRTKKFVFVSVWGAVTALDIIVKVLS
jgi:hypothetical protein